MNYDAKNILMKLAIHSDSGCFFDQESGEYLDLDDQDSLIGILNQAYENADSCPCVDELCFDLLEILYQISFIKTSRCFEDNSQKPSFFEYVTMYITEIVHMLFIHYQYWIKLKRINEDVGTINSLETTILLINIAWLFVTSGEDYNFYWNDIVNDMDFSIKQYHL
ncbi:MAG: hypothetical protein LBU34_11415, partial [Planctomycetaceae bacterium]|nr:hypothetical protein [Planctomycetaceae bacterium]